jgi:predicted ATPase
VVKKQNMENEIKSHYSYTEVINWLEAKGIELYGNHFKIIETDYPIVYKLIAYSLKDEPTCFQYGINLNKGILLTGPIGCGKTSLMNLMKYLTATEHKFFVKPCRDISFENTLSHQKHQKKQSRKQGLRRQEKTDTPSGKQRYADTPQDTMAIIP